MSRGLAFAAALAFLAPVSAAVAIVVTDDERASASAVSRPAEPATPPARTRLRAVSFAGTTSQRLAIAFELTAGGRAIEGLQVSYRAACGGKGGLEFELDDVFYAPVAVAADGSFLVRGFGKRLTFGGKIDHGRASGTVRVDYAYGGLFQCVTPDLRWTATS